MQSIPPSEAESTFTIEHVCRTCHGSSTKRCARCGTAYYCSKTCLKKDFGRHNVFCKKIIDENESAKKACLHSKKLIDQEAVFRLLMFERFAEGHFNLVLFVDAETGTIKHRPAPAECDEFQKITTYSVTESKLHEINHENNWAIFQDVANYTKGIVVVYLSAKIHVFIMGSSVIEKWKYVIEEIPEEIIHPIFLALKEAQREPRSKRGRHKKKHTNTSLENRKKTIDQQNKETNTEWIPYVLLEKNSFVASTLDETNRERPRRLNENNKALA